MQIPIDTPLTCKKLIKIHKTHVLPQNLHVLRSWCIPDMSFNFIAGFAGQDDPDISPSFILPSCWIGRNTQIVASPHCGCMGFPVSAQENLNCQQTSEELGEWSRNKTNCSLKCLGWWFQTNGWFATCFETANHYWRGSECAAPVGVQAGRALAGRPDGKRLGRGAVEPELVHESP